MLGRRLIIMLLAVALVVAALAAYKGLSIKKQMAQLSAPRPPIVVSAESAQSMDWQSRLPAIGSLKAFQGVELTAEVSGTVNEVLFKSGQQVTLGQALLQMDGSVERAMLDTAIASRNLARVEYERGKNLAGKQAISKSEFDRLNAELIKAEASVKQLQASLDKKHIQAPFAGTIGIRQVDVGDYLNPGKAFATLQDLSKLYVDFFLPEQDVPKIRVGQSVQVQVAAYPKQTFTGELSAFDPKVDDNTRNLKVRALLPNPEGKLLPGMFANLQVLLPHSEEAIVVPQTALTYTLYGNSVYVVRKAEQGDDLIAERRFVESGEQRDGLVVISKGLVAGDQVITSGQLKLDNGASVRLVDDPALPRTSQAGSAE